MRSENCQTDIFRDRPANAADYRAAAEAALRNPFETPDAAQRRHDHYMAQAEQLEQRV